MELIVVIAILGILAGIAVPMYTGYIKRANDAKVLSELSGVLTTAQAANAMVGSVEEVTKITVTNAGVVTVTTGTDTVATNTDAYKNAFVDLYDEGGAKVDRGNLQIEGFSSLINDTSYDDNEGVGGGATWTSVSQKWTPGIPASEP